jgi:hypothetical protein
MKGKYISALVGIGAAAMFALPGVASAATSSQAKPETMPVSCEHRQVPPFDQGKKVWVLEGYGPRAKCVLVLVRGYGHGHGHGHGNPGHGNPGHGKQSHGKQSHGKHHG